MIVSDLTDEVDVQVLLVDPGRLETHDVLRAILDYVHDRHPLRARGLERERRKERLRQEPGGQQPIEHPIELLAQLPRDGGPQRDSHNTSVFGSKLRRESTKWCMMRA